MVDIICYENNFVNEQLIRNLSNLTRQYRVIYVLTMYQVI